MALKKWSNLQTVYMISFIVMMIILSELWYAVQRYNTFRDNHLQTIQKEVELISDGIGAHLANLKSQTRLFSNVYQDRIELIVDDPHNELNRQGLKYRMEYMLPGAIGFHLTDEQGFSLQKDINDEEVEDCGDEFLASIKEHDAAEILEIHGQPDENHFDIVVNWRVDREDLFLKKGSLIISYRPDSLAHILSQKVNKNNQLFLMKDSVDGLIEISESGSRDSLERPSKLSEEEINRIGYSKRIIGTRWVLAEIYPQTLLVNMQRSIMQEFIISILAVIVIFALLIWKIRRDKKSVERAEVFLSNILANLPGIVFRAEMRPDGGLNYSFISSGAEELLGYSAEDLQVNPGALFRAAHAEDVARFYNEINRSSVNLTPMRIEYRIIKKGGDYLWVREITRPYKSDNGDIVWNGLILDISDLKETEQKLVVHYGALNAANESVIITDAEGGIEWSNLAFSNLTGFSIEDVKLHYISILLDTSSEARKDIEDALTWQKSWQGELILKHKSGAMFPADTSLTPVFSDTGIIKNYIAIIRDLTEKKALETQLLAAQKMESIGQLAAGIAHEINTPTQFVGDNVHFLKDVIDDSLSMLQTLEILQQQLKDHEMSQDQVLPVIDKLIEQADLEFIREEAPAAINQSLEGLGRISRIVGAMKDFSHPGNTGMESMDLNHIIKTTVTIARNEWKYVADLDTDLDRNLPSIFADSQLLGQAILNFIVNAAHAIAEKQQGSGVKGLIKISTRQINDRVEMRVSDNGTGIPDEVRQRIFEPFFTTKEVGKGSGQGLAIAYSGIIEKQKGSIDVESTLGEGTTFIINLPVETSQTAMAS